MHGTVSQKIGRVVSNLVLNPQYISRCLSHNVLNKTPLDLEVPWFSYAAIDFLDEFAEPHMNVFEYGSGGSTLFFARRAKSVLSVEDNRKWYELVSTRIKDEGLVSASLKLCPFDFKTAAAFEESEYLHALPDERFDIVGRNADWHGHLPCVQRVGSPLAVDQLIGALRELLPHGAPKARSIVRVHRVRQTGNHAGRDAKRQQRSGFSRHLTT